MNQQVDNSSESDSESEGDQYSITVSQQDHGIVIISVVSTSWGVKCMHWTRLMMSW